jgi:hypothetical protein
MAGLVVAVVVVDLARVVAEILVAVVPREAGDAQADATNLETPLG